MYKAVIIEDEKKSREALKNLVSEYCPEITRIALAESVEAGISCIRETEPDIVFLDIEMQTGTGFDLLERLGTVNFEVIFTTAYEQYALKAIKFSALDYLLKPIDVEELKAAVKKVAGKRLKSGEENSQIAQLIRNMNNRAQPRITLSTSEGYVFVNVDEIIRCEAQGAYTVFHLKADRKIMVSKNLKEYEQLLSDHSFYRIHNSHLINLHEVEKYVKSDGGYVVMKDKSKVLISATRKDEFLELSKQL